MRLLVIGANGLLGSNVVRAGRQHGWDVLGTFHSNQPLFDVPLAHFDLKEAGLFSRILAEHEPEIVINCAAMTDVDACETNPDTAHLLNGEAPGRLAAECRAKDVKFVHISTDYVFDGTGHQPYSEAAETSPVQVYGESKLAGERTVQEALSNSLIARLSFVWGIHRSSGKLTGFPAWVHSCLEEGDDVPLFTDQRITPTRAGQAAESLIELLEVNAEGLYHLACSSCVTPYEFGGIIADRTGSDGELLAESSINDVERDAARPVYSCLDVDRLEVALERPQPTLREDVEAVGHAFS